METKRHAWAWLGPLAFAGAAIVFAFAVLTVVGLLISAVVLPG